MINNATVELAARASETTSDALIDDLGDFHPAAARGVSGHQAVTITVQAEHLRQATTVALALL